MTYMSMHTLAHEPVPQASYNLLCSWTITMYILKLCDVYLGVDIDKNIFQEIHFTLSTLRVLPHREGVIKISVFVSLPYRCCIPKKVGA